MKILICIASMESGGAERQVTYLAKAFHDAGNEVFILLINKGSNYSRLVDSGVTIEFVDIYPKRYRFVRPLISAFKRIDPDFIYIWQRPFDCLGSMAAILSGYPFIYAERTDPHKVPFCLKVLFRNVMVPFASAIIANSTEGVRYWKNRLPRMSVSRIPNVVPLEELGRVVTAKLSVDLISTGRLEEIKNPLKLLQAIKELREEGMRVTLAMVGGGSLEAELKNFIDFNDMSDQVQLFGYRSDVWSLLKACPNFISLSFFEGEPNAVLEAAALGCRLILSDIPSHRDIFIGTEATFVNPYSIEDIKIAIKSVVGAPFTKTLEPKILCKALQDRSPKMVLEKHLIEFSKNYKKHVAWVQLGAEALKKVNMNEISNKRVKILYLYAEVMSYTVATVTSLIQDFNAEVHIIHWDHKKLTPYLIPHSIPHMYLYNRSELSGEDMVKIAFEINPDITVVSGWWDREYLKVAKLLRSGDRKTVVALDGQWYGNLRQIFGAILAARGYLSQYFSNAWVAGPLQFEYARRLGFSKNQIIFDLLSADILTFEKAYRDSKNVKRQKYPKKLLYVGRFEREKGLDILIKAWEKIKSPFSGWELILIGNGSMKNSLKNLDSVVVKDFMQPTQLIEEVKSSGCFVLPSRIEPWGVVVHEFAAAGLPLILSDRVGALNTFLIDGINGYSFKAENVDDLAKKLLNIMLSDDSDLLLMSSESHKIAKTITPLKSASRLLSIMSR